MAKQKYKRFKLKKRSPFNVLLKSYANKGINYQLYWFIISVSRNNKITRFLIDISAYVFYKLFRSHKTFLFQGKKYSYFYHLYNRTIASERVVEIPIARDFIQRYKGKDVLEVGNVLSHYFPTNHDVLDKYEKGEGVINEDVVDFKPKKKYDLIISVSTMEHVGFSYGEPLEPEKFTKGIENLTKSLKRGGILVVTFSLYYNSYITELIKTNNAPFTKEFYMKRCSFWNEWKEIDHKEALKGEGYDSHFANANILYVGEFTKKS